ncbi:MAG: tetratricopeptide repeat protein [Parvibaculales bacterium]
MGWQPALIICVFIGLSGALFLTYRLGRNKLTSLSERVAYIAGLFGVPVSAFLIYLYFGNPQMPDTPLKPRLEGAIDDLPPAAVISMLEQKLISQSDDVQGWRLLARIRVELNQPDLAAQAWRQILYYQNKDFEALFGLVKANLEVNDGLIDSESAALIGQLSTGLPDHYLTNFYLGLLAAQEGEAERAKAFFIASGQAQPDNQVWQNFIAAQISKLNTP